MTTSTAAFFVLRPSPNDPTLAPEAAPCIMWGQGTPAGTIAPWATAQKGSLWVQVDATDDYPHVFVKVDEGSDANDWKPLLAADSTSTGQINFEYNSGSPHYVSTGSTSGSALYWH